VKTYSIRIKEKAEKQLAALPLDIADRMLEQGSTLERQDAGMAIARRALIYPLRGNTPRGCGVFLLTLLPSGQTNPAVLSS
jgi:mRNA-degrading endonuclease RelE of RelBE toxin-antitoxin system